nr:MAG: hypothetical protein DIU78_06860 [Pseudomonadota bacterium]
MRASQAAARAAHANGPRAASAVAALAAAVALCGCDIVQGFQDAGDALFPEERTHLNAPGLHLARGNYRHLRFAIGTELYLLARSPEGDPFTLYSMLYANPKPCAIPNVANFQTSFGTYEGPALIAYFGSDTGNATLRFADASCRAYPFTVDTPSFPVAETTRGFVVPARVVEDDTERVGLLLVDPVSERREQLAIDVEGVWPNTFAGHHLVKAQGKALIFAPDWTLLGAFGTTFDRAVAGSNALLVQDVNGIHRVTLDGAVKLVRQNACGLAQRGSFVFFGAPCEQFALREDFRLYAYDDRTAHVSELPFRTWPWNVELRRARDANGNDPAVDPFWAFYLGLDDGALFVRTPSGETHEIGKASTLDRVELVDTSEDTYGYALVDITGDTGTFVHWTPDGTVRRLAERVLRHTSRLVLDWDGVTGTLAAPVRDTIVPVADKVPSRGFELVDRRRRWTVLFHDFDGISGRLSLLEGDLDAGKTLVPGAPLPRYSLREIATNVGHFRSTFLDQVLPGILYMTDIDHEKGVGRVEYRNLELGFTALMSYGVSDFVVAPDEVLYTVPYGEGAGIWLVQAK